METPKHNTLQSKNLEVTGVSRSGRVRKKSSKLLDFQSSDKVEKKSKRGRRYSGGNSAKTAGDLSQSEDYELLDQKLGDDDVDIPEKESVRGNLEETPYGNNTTDPNNSDVELDELVANLVDDVEAESLENVNESKVRSSLYMTEKANKCKILKNGKVITGKMERKDKGKSRYTAYGLWAREYRKSARIGKNKDLDFPTAARRLGELWANVSNKDKTAWRRKAKALAFKAKQSESVGTLVKETATEPFVPNKFQNRPTTNRTKKLAAERQKPTATPVSKTLTALGKHPTKRQRNSSKNSTATITSSDQNGGNVDVNSNGLGSETDNAVPEPPGIQPIDAAAHLKLLGDSLTVIGERLKEHDGQIAVSGSISVLLDSLLCSVAPLMCLTTCIPGLKDSEQLKINLRTTLDNIAYVMPGL